MKNIYKKRWIIWITFSLFLIILMIIVIFYWTIVPVNREDNSQYRKNSIIIGSISDATSMIPILSTDSISHEINNWCYNGLVKYDKKLNLTSELANYWIISKDKLTITFRLRHGIYFHDGHPFTSADVLFTWRLMINPTTPTPYASDYLKIKHVEIPNRYTFRVTYNNPFAPGISSWSIAQLPAHLLENQDIRQSSFNRHPIGTGPFQFCQWLSGSQIELSAFQNYWEGSPHLDSLFFRIIPDPAALFLELRSRGIDWMELTPLQYQRQTETNYFKNNFRKYRYPASSYTYIAWNLRDERFADKRIRQALSYAINKEELIKGVLLGLGQPATGPFKPNTYYYNPNVKIYSYNLAKAKQLFAEAGWIANTTGQLIKKGQPFNFTLLTNQGNQTRQNIGVIIQQRLAELGIKVELRIIEWSSFIQEFVNKGRFEAVLLGWSISPDPDQYDIWHSNNIGPGKLNINAYKNSSVDKLLIEGRQLFEPNRRKAIYDSLQEILADDAAYTFLCIPDAMPIVHARFQNINPSPAGIAYNLNKWYISKSMWTQ